MCYAGANSETASQLKDLLNLTDLHNDDIFKLIKELNNSINTELGEEVQISTANKLYPKKDIQLSKEFSNALVEYFLSEIEPVDFSNAEETSKTINDWVSKKTNSKINDLLKSRDIDKDAQLILVNAIHFKARWDIEFEPSSTKKDDFTLSDGNKISVDMMNLYGKRFNTATNFPGLNAIVCTVPYKQRTVSMTIILPKENFKLEQVENELKSINLIEIIGPKPQHPKVDLYLPKFKLDYFKEVNYTLFTRSCVRIVNFLSKRLRDLCLTPKNKLNNF